MWSNARMRYHEIDKLEVSMKLNAHLRALVDSTFADLPRVYLARWHDEDEGWKSMQVVAGSEQEVRDTISALTNCPIRVYRSAL